MSDLEGYWGTVNSSSNAYNVINQDRTQIGQLAIAFHLSAFLQTHDQVLLMEVLALNQPHNFLTCLLNFHQLKSACFQISWNLLSTSLDKTQHP